MTQICFTNRKSFLFLNILILTNRKHKRVVFTLIYAINDVTSPGLSIIHRQTYRQTDRQTDRQTEHNSDRPAGMRSSRQYMKQTDGQTRRTDKQTPRWMPMVSYMLVKIPSIFLASPSLTNHVLCFIYS